MHLFDTDPNREPAPGQCSAIIRFDGEVDAVRCIWGATLRGRCPDHKYMTEYEHDKNRRLSRAIGDVGLCPVCGKDTDVVSISPDDRLIGRCGDAFTLARWESE